MGILDDSVWYDLRWSVHIEHGVREDSQSVTYKQMSQKWR